jgi:hypothetical protein
VTSGFSPKGALVGRNRACVASWSGTVPVRRCGVARTG